MTITAPADAGPGRLTDRELQARITGPDARCVAWAGDPDEWFPVTSEPAKARAVSACAGPVRGLRGTGRMPGAGAAVLGGRRPARHLGRNA
jgi:hypothetical protein